MQRCVNNCKPLCYLLSLLLIIEGILPSMMKADDELLVKNIYHTTAGDKIILHYDLVGSVDQEYTVRVVLRRLNNAQYRYEPKSLSGAVQQGKHAGSDRQIIWEILRDIPQGLDGDDFYFMVTAEAVSSSNLLYYIIGGVAVVGAGGYYFLKPKASVIDDKGFPVPPIRPGN